MWKTIDTAPRPDPLKELSPVRIVCWAGHPDSVTMLRWKHNHRISGAIKEGLENPEGLVPEYWGDPEEYDDYDLAKPGAGPTHWLDYPPVPKR